MVQNHPVAFITSKFFAGGFAALSVLAPLVEEVFDLQNNFNIHLIKLNKKSKSYS